MQKLRAGSTEEHWVDTCRNDLQQKARDLHLTDDNEYLLMRGVKTKRLKQNLCQKDAAAHPPSASCEGSPAPRRTTGIDRAPQCWPSNSGPEAIVCQQRPSEGRPYACSSTGRLRRLHGLPERRQREPTSLIISSEVRVFAQNGTSLRRCTESLHACLITTGGSLRRSNVFPK